MKATWLWYPISVAIAFYFLPVGASSEGVQESCITACVKLVTPSLKVGNDKRCILSDDELYPNDERGKCSRYCAYIAEKACDGPGTCTTFSPSLEAPSTPQLLNSVFTSVTLQWNSSRNALVYVLHAESIDVPENPLEILPFVPKYYFINATNYSSAVNFTVENLLAETKYKFRVAAFNRAGFSGYSEWSTWYPTNNKCKTTNNYPCPTSQLKLNVSLEVMNKRPVVLDAMLSWKLPSGIENLRLFFVEVKLLDHVNGSLDKLCRKYHDNTLKKTFIINGEEIPSNHHLRNFDEIGRVIHLGCRYSVKISTVKPAANTFDSTTVFHIPECLEGVRSCPISDVNVNTDNHVSSPHVDTKISRDSNGNYTTAITWTIEAWRGLPKVEFFHITVEIWPTSSRDYYYINDTTAVKGVSVYRTAPSNMLEGKIYRVQIRAYHGKNCIHDVVIRETFRIVKPCNGTCISNSTCLPKNTYDGSASCRCNEGFTLNGTFCAVIPPSPPQPSVKSKKENLNVAAIVVPLAVIVPLVVLAGFLLWRRRQKRKKMAQELFNGMPITIERSSSSSNLYRHFPSTRRSSTDVPAKVIELPAEREVNVIYVPQEIQDAIACGLTDGYEFNSEQLRLGVCLGRGAFGNVYCAEAQGIGTEPGWTSVAVKTLSEAAMGKGADDFIEEIELMKMLGDHENVIKMLGCCTLSMPICLILEYAPYGSLLDYLRSLRNELVGNIMTKDATFKEDMQKDKSSCEQAKDVDGKDSDEYSSKKGITEKEDTTVGQKAIKDPHSIDGVIEASELQSFAFQIAKGMAYVAGLGIVHRDLAARNILIGNDRILKISDFGLSREGIYVKTTSGKIPLRWLSVEAIRERLYSSASDVWAFGIVLWEICTLGGFPYPDISDRELLRFLEKGNRMEKPSNCTNEIYSIMLDCWSYMPGDRPTFGNIRDLLWKLENNENPYVNIDPLEVYNFPPIDEGSLDDFGGSFSSNDTPFPDAFSKPQLEASSSNAKGHRGMPNPAYRPVSLSTSQQGSDDSDSRKGKDEILEEKVEGDAASQPC